jgi:hypothetical protein
VSASYYIIQEKMNFIKIAKSLIVATTLVFVLCISSYADSDVTVGGAWLRDANGWWYCNRDRSYTTDNWQQIYGNWYYFDSNGYLVTGWKQSPVDGKWYYLDPTGEPDQLGRMLTNQWIGDFYVGSDGAWVESGSNTSNTPASAASSNSSRNAQESAAGTATQATTKYSDSARRGFSRIKNEYPGAELLCAYAQPFTNANKHKCVLVVVGYRIIKAYSDDILFDLTDGNVIRNPSQYYDKRADRAYGKDQMKELDNSIAVLKAGEDARTATLSVLKNGVNTGTGEFYYPWQLGF